MVQRLIRTTRVLQVMRGVAVGVGLGLLSSCSAPAPPQSEASPIAPPSPVVANAPKVVATTTILCDLVRQIAQNTVDLTCLLKPGVDGHVYQPVPGDRKAIEDAQLILYSGYDFEPGLIKLIQSTSNPAPKIAVAERAVPKPLMGHAHAEHADDDHAGDDHAHEEPAGHAEAGDTPDPHVWQSAANGAKMATVVQEALIALNRDRQTEYAQTGKALVSQLQAIHQWIQGQIATIPEAQRQLVTTHEAMAYYADAYNIPIDGVLQGLSTEAKPTPTQVKALVDQVVALQVPTIFAEVVVNPKLIEAIARDAKVKVAAQPLYTDSLGGADSEAQTYPQMLIVNTRTIVQGLNGRYVAFAPAATP